MNHTRWFERRRWIHLFWLFSLLIGLAAGAAPVQAHALLERSDPPNNAILLVPPRQIRLWFSEPVLPRFSTVRLLDINGQEVKGVSLVPNSGDLRLLVVDVPVLGEGVYSLDWQVLSISDGHTTQGLLVFGIGQRPINEASAQPANFTFPTLLQAGGRIATDLTLFGLSGALMVSFVLLAGRSGMDYQRARRRAAGWSLALALLGVLAGLAQLAAEQWGSGALAKTGGLDLSGLSAMLTLTQWGQLWLFRQVVLLLTAAFLFAVRNQLARPGGRLTWGMAVILASAALAALALSSHAASLETPASALLFTWLHYLAASLWVGGLIALAFLLLPFWFREPGAVDFTRSILADFGRYAFTAVILTLTTGLFNTADLVASSGALVTTVYGQALLRKVALVLLVGLFGLVNSLALHPALSRSLAKLLRRPAGWQLLDARRLPLTIAIEVVLGISVIALAGVLASSSPANGVGYQYAGISQYESLSKQVGDLLVTFAVRPNHPGQNLADVLAVSTRKPPPAETLRVILRMTYQGKAFGTQNGDALPIDTNLYRLGGSYFSLPGPWKVEVIIRRKGLPDSVAAFNWNVLPISAGRFDFVLRYPLRYAAGGLLVVGLLAVVWLFRGARARSAPPS